MRTAMRITTCLAAIALVVGLAGCVPTLSLHPLFDASARITEPALEGTWVEKKEKEPLTLTLRPWGENAYELVYMDDDDKERRLRGELARLGNYLFLDVTSSDKTFDDLHIAVHWFFRVRLDGDALELAYLDDDWLRSMVRDKKVAIAHEVVGTDILLTAPGKDLQALVLKYASDPNAFVPVRFQRRKYPRAEGGGESYVAFRRP